MLQRVSTPILLDCDPGHDDAIALLLALGSDELELRGVTTVAGNQTLEKTTANAIRVLELAGRAEIPVAAGAGRPLVREPRVAADVHGETGLDGPDLPPPQAEPSPQHAVDFLAERVDGRDARRHRPADERRAPAGPLPGGEAGADRADGRRDRRGQRHARGRVQHLGRPGGRAARLRERARRDDGRTRRHPPGAGRPPAHAHSCARAGRVGKVVAELLEFYGGFHRSVYGWDGSPIHDAVAVAHVIDPGLLEIERLNVRIDIESELCRGRTVVDLWRRTGLEPTANVAVGIDSERFVDLLARAARPARLSGHVRRPRHPPDPGLHPGRAADPPDRAEPARAGAGRPLRAPDGNGADEGAVPQALAAEGVEGEPGAQEPRARQRDREARAQRRPARPAEGPGRACPA